MTIQTRPRAVPRTTPRRASPGGAQDTRQAIGVPTTTGHPPAGADSHPTAVEATTDTDSSGGAQLADGHRLPDTQREFAVSDQHADRRRAGDIHRVSAVGGDAAPDPAANDAPTTKVSSLLDPALALAADVVDDLERVRIANENRLRQLTRSTEDSDGETRGFGLDESHPDVARLAAMVETLAKVEKAAVLNLQRHMRRHALGPWAKGIRGAGEKQVARLLAAIGDPYIRPQIEREDGTVLPEGPRTVSALWAYCGLHVLPADGQLPRDTRNTSATGREGGDSGHAQSDAPLVSAGVAARRAKGQRANWSTNAKTRAYLIAASCLKQLDSHCRAGHRESEDQAEAASAAVRHLDDCACSPYRVVYDRRRGHTASTRPDWTDGHSHNDALRVAAKEFLKDLWREARRLHGDHDPMETTT